MQKIVLTKSNKGIVCVDFRQMPMPELCGGETELRKEKPWDVALISEEKPSGIGKICVGHVRDVVKNIEAAFVEIGPDEIGFLSLRNCSPVFLNRKNTDKVCEGDSIIVEIEKDPIKTKDAVLTAQFSIKGRLVILTHGKSGISISSKIKDGEFRKNISASMEECLKTSEISESYGIIVRTDAYRESPEAVIEEWKQLEQQYKGIIELAKTRQKYYVLREPESQVMRFLQNNLDVQEESEIVTDCQDIYNDIEKSDLIKRRNSQLRMYADKLLPLYKLYSLETLFEEIVSKKVWLKSGGYLVVEHTEAMTVIDVNTGKCEKGKNKEKTFHKINVEAAWEIARQLRIRNISGIIIVDFIDNTEEYTRELLEYTRQITSYDSVKVNVVDVTKLHLMEITRKKTTDRITDCKELF